MSITHLAFLPLAAGLLLGAVPDAERKDAPKEWGTVVDPDGDCRVRQDGDRITITVPPTHHDLTYTDKFMKLNAPRVLKPVTGDFRLEATVPAVPLPAKGTSSSGAHSFVSGGLLVWADDKNFIRLDRAAEGESGSEFVWVERFTDGMSAAQKLHPVKNLATALRVERRGDRLTFAIRQALDPDAWEEVHAEDVKLPAAVRVGAHAINTTTREFAPRLEGLRLTAMK